MKTKNTKQNKLTAQKPKIRQAKDLIATTQQVLGEAESLAGGPILTYWNSNSGMITDDDSDALRVLLSDYTPVKTLYLCLTSDGGNGEASLRLAEVVRKYCQNLVVIVPRFARSAATMWALAADEVWLGHSACLGPVDTSIKHPLAPTNQGKQKCNVGQDELTRIIKLWRSENTKDGTNPYSSLYQYIHPLVIGAIDRAATLSMRICDSLLAYHEPQAKIRQRIAKELVYAYPSHSFPIMLREAQRIGIKAKSIVNPKLDATLMRLNALYASIGEMQRHDFDVNHHYQSDLPIIMECQGKMMVYRKQGDWTWIDEKREWFPLNNDNGWRLLDAKTKKEQYIHFY